MIALALALAGCGRIGFDLLGGRGDGGGVDDAGSNGGIDAATIPAGALVWLKMNTGPSNGVGIVDSAGFHTSSCQAACPQRLMGLHSYGYLFATEEVITSGTGADLDAASGFTGAVWLRLSSLPTSLACAWTKPFAAASGFDSFTLCIDDVGTTIFDAETPGGVANQQNGPAIAAGEWHHLAITWDGTTKRDYLDGSLVGSSTVQLGHSAEALNLGGARGAFFVTGILDDALYYGRGLTAAEIQLLATP